MKRITNLILLVFIGFSLNAQTIKTVGSGGNYPSLQSAFSTINAGSITGAITLKVISSITETGTVTLNASGSGSSNYSSVLIYPTGSGYTINGSINGLFINLNGAKNVTIDGRVNEAGAADLTISNTSTSAIASTITFINTASGNTVEYCNVQGSSTNASGGVIFFSTASAGVGNSNNIITNCNLTNAGTRPVNMIYSAGSATYTNSSNTISNNNIYNFFNAGATSYGINIGANSTGWSITGNSIYDNTTIVPSGTFAYYCININNTSGNNFTITGNYIGGSGALCSGTLTINNSLKAPTFVGISTNVGTTLATASSVQNNTISGISLTTGSGLATVPGIFTGIYITGGAINVGTSTGNIIGAISGSGNISITSTATSTTSLIMGIYATSIGTVSIQNNTIASDQCNRDYCYSSIYILWY